MGQSGRDEERVDPVVVERDDPNVRFDSNPACTPSTFVLIPGLIGLLFAGLMYNGSVTARRYSFIPGATLVAIALVLKILEIRKGYRAKMAGKDIEESANEEKKELEVSTKVHTTRVPASSLHCTNAAKENGTQKIDVCISSV
mmetsp:Transcript_7579/g.12230  ORF Transcript_7579/g.12230 Transcript_7579/m.12230 type:complete len:143 (-) Transcript_7579:507-935(-)|eukprot:CAMPEP_0203761354 /NCGR_PEP_ID=MMETSP0098-20131031/14463_1 /ASSEMBLY_ACC=CAM_ASM_000208 /TAXON_ID=96639 /ORGANISM=" , Strain NY0313808BC1" /LENGTH=142 /DNA_ID=CAMNT_0050655315 /DNA_START=309 /DNA_END=737 /DNA_ORIENTATION=-